MKKRLFTILSVLLLSLLVSSCNTKEHYLNNFEKFVADVEQNGNNYSEQDWDDISEEYDAFVGDYLEQYSDQLTKEDFKQVGRLKARYHKAWIKYAATQIGNAFNSSSQIAAGYLEEMSDGSDMDEFDASLSEVFEELLGS